MEFIEKIQKSITILKKSLTKEKFHGFIIEAMKEYELIKEMSSYNRVRSHIEEGEPFVIMSSDRHERTPSENREAYKQFKSDFQSAGFPFTELKGGFKETTRFETDPETGEEVEVELEEPEYVIENSILITTHAREDIPADNTAEDLFDIAIEISQKYDQEAFIFGETAQTARGTKTKIINAFDKTGAEIQESWAGPWTSVETVSNDADFWSRIKGKHFQLKENKKTSQPKSWIEAMKKSRSGLKW